MTGQTDQRVIVALPSLFFGSSMFAPLIQRLPERRWVTLDYPGQGDRVAEMAPAKLEDLADRVLAELDSIGSDPVHLVGSAMGAYVAMHAADRAPMRFQSLTLLNATSEAERDPGRFGALEAAILKNGMGAVADSVVGMMFGDTFLKTRTVEVEHWRAQFARLPPTVATAVRSVFTRNDLTEVSQRLKVPIFAVGGTEDRAKSPQDMARIALARPGRLFCMVPQSGHSAVIENPCFLAPLLRDWWRAVEQGHFGERMPT